MPCAHQRVGINYSSATCCACRCRRLYQPVDTRMDSELLYRETRHDVGRSIRRLPMVFDPLCGGHNAVGGVRMFVGASGAHRHRPGPCWSNHFNAGSAGAGAIVTPPPAIFAGESAAICASWTPPPPLHGESYAMSKRLLALPGVTWCSRRSAGCRSGDIDRGGAAAGGKSHQFIVLRVFMVAGWASPAQVIAPDSPQRLHLLFIAALPMASIRRRFPRSYSVGGAARGSSSGISLSRFRVFRNAITIDQRTVLTQKVGNIHASGGGSRLRNLLRGSVIGTPSGAAPVRAPNRAWIPTQSRRFKRSGEVRHGH